MKKNVYALAALVVLVCAFAVPNVYIQYQIDNATLDIESITVLGARRSSLICRVNMTFDNPSISARTFPTTLDIFSGGRHFASTDVPALDIKEGTNEFSVTSEVRMLDKNFAGELVREITSKKALTWRFKGSLAVGLDGSSFPMSFNTIDKSVPIECMAGLSVDVRSVRLHNFTNSSFALGVDVALFNPSIFSVHLDGITLQMKIGDVTIGKANVSGQTINSGNSLLNTEVECAPDPDAEQALKCALERTLAGDDVNITLSGAAGYSPMLDAYLLERFEQQASLPGIKGLNISVEGIDVLESKYGQLEILARMRLDNPSNIQGEMGQVTLEMLYENKVVAKLIHDSLLVKTGTTTSYERLKFVPIRNDILGWIVSQTLEGKDVFVTVRGDNSSDTIASRMLSKAERVVPVRAGAPVALAIDRLLIEECAPEKLVFSINATIDNDSPITGNLTRANLELCWKGKRVGNLTLEPFHLLPGKNKVTGYGVIAPEEPSTARELVKAYLSGEAVSAQVQGRQCLEGDAMQVALSFTKTNVTLAGAHGRLSVEGEKAVLLNSSGELLNIGVGISIYNPTFITGYVGNMSLKVFYGASHVGTLRVPSVWLNPGSNAIYQEVSIRPSSATSLFELGTATLDGLGVSFTLTGDESDDSVLSQLLSTYNANVSIAPSGKIGVAIERACVREASEGLISMTLYATINNPTMLEGTLDSVSYDVYYDGTLVGRMSSRGMYVTSGENAIVTQSYIAPADEEAARRLVAKYLAGEDVYVDVTAYLDSVMGGLWLAHQSVKITGYSGLCVEIIEARLVDSRPGELEVFANMDIFNPAPLSGDMGEISIDTYYEGAYVCTVSVPTLYLNQGWNHVKSFGKIAPIDENTAFDMVSQVLAGNEVTLMLQGDQNSTMLMPRLIGLTTSNTTISPSGKVSISPSSIKFLNSTPENMTMDAEFDLYNPTALTTDALCLYGRAYYKGRFLGNLSSTEMSVSSGVSHARCVVTITQPDTLLGSELMGDYLTGHDVEFQVVGSLSKEGRRDAPVLFSVNLTIEGTGALDITLGEVTLTKAEEEHLHTIINLTISNPTIITGAMGTVTLNVHYNDSLVGNLSTDELELRNGMYQVSLNCTLVPVEIPAMTRILNRVFAGENVTLVINGARIPGELLSSFLAEYQCNLTIMSYGTLSIVIDDMAIAGGTANALLLSIDLTVNNPTTLEANLPTLYFDIYEYGLEVGFLALAPTYICRGATHVSTPASLDGPNAHISDILTRHVNGTDVVLTIRGSSSNADGVLAQALVGFEQSATIKGVSEPLITAVSIDQIDIHINLGVTAYVTVYIHNPTDFTFNVTFLSADIYFDDNDTSSLLIWSYEPAYHIYLGTVVKTLSPPMFLTGFQNATVSTTLDVQSIENEVRLNDEYYNDNDLYVDAIGYIIIKVGGFSVPVYFAQYSIYVPND